MAGQTVIVAVIYWQQDSVLHVWLCECLCCAPEAARDSAVQWEIMGFKGVKASIKGLERD